MRDMPDPNAKAEPNPAMEESLRELFMEPEPIGEALTNAGIPPNEPAGNKEAGEVPEQRDEISEILASPGEPPNEPNAPPDEVERNEPNTTVEAEGTRETDYQWEPYTPPDPQRAAQTLCHDAAGLKPVPATSQPMSGVTFAKVKSKLTRNLNLRAWLAGQTPGDTYMIGRITRNYGETYTIPATATEPASQGMRTVYECAWAVREFEDGEGLCPQRPPSPGEIDESALWDIL